jgi:hypothetical protein
VINPTNSLVVLNPGQRVMVGPYHGTILETIISPGPHVTYRVSWWDAGTRNVQYLERNEFTPADSLDCMFIGFPLPEQDNA